LRTLVGIQPSGEHSGRLKVHVVNTYTPLLAEMGYTSTEILTIFKVALNEFGGNAEKGLPPEP
jgi:hypothetical protein